MASKRRAADKEKARKRQALLDYTEEYLNQCADIMRLGYYTIEVTDVVPDDAFMEIHTAPNQLAVDVDVGQPFHDADPELKRQTVAHELSHFHIGKITETVEALFRDYVPPVSWDTLFEQVSRCEELAADEFGHVVAPLLPKWNPPKGVE